MYILHVYGGVVSECVNVHLCKCKVRFPKKICYFIKSMIQMNF